MIAYTYTYTHIHTIMASAFNLLTSGGARFDKNRFKKDIDLFTGVSPSSTFNALSSTSIQGMAA